MDNENDNGNFYYNLADAKLYRRKTLGPNVQSDHNVLHQIITLRTSTQ